MRTVVAWLALAVTPIVLSAQRPDAARCSSLQYRFIDYDAPTTAARHRSVQDGQSYALRDSIVVDGQGIADVQVFPHAVGSDTTWDVLARLTPAGGSAMAAATAHNLGHTLAALLDDTIVAHAPVASALRSRVPVRLGAAHREADSIAARARRASGTGCRTP